jgi:MFS transporter, DHA1 family, tetracycline resistance protein
LNISSFSARVRMTPAKRAAPGPASQVSIYPILAVNFVGTLGFSIVLPFLVYLVTRLGGNALVYGILGATYSFFQLLGAPVLGRWSDRYGRRRILLLSQVGTFLSWGIFLVALRLPVTPLLEVHSTWLGVFTVTLPLLVLFFARALDGITGGNVSVANAYLADISDDSNRSANYGRMSVSANLGFILGPAIAGLLGALATGERLPVLAAFVISLAASLMIALWLPEAEPCALNADPEKSSVRKILGQDHKPCFQLAAAPRLSTRQILALPSVSRLLGLHFLVYLAFNLFYVSFPVYAATGIHWSLTKTGVFFSAMGLMMALVQGPVLKHASKRWPDRTLVLGGSLALAASFPFFGATHTATLYLGTALLALGNGLMWPSLLSILAKTAGRDVQGAVQGFAGSIAAVASIVGLLAGGLLYTLMGSHVFLISAALTTLTFMLAFGIPVIARK